MPASQKQHHLSQSKDDLSRPLRSASPAIKRPASDMGAQEREHYNSDVEMGDSEGPLPTSASAQPSPDTKAKQQDTGQRHREKSSADSFPPHADPKFLHHPASDNSANSAPDSLIPSPSNQSTADSSLNSDVYALPPTVVSPPTLDHQVTKITQLLQTESQEGDKGYLVSQKWIFRVQARSSFASDLVNVPKSATDGEIGPVDNSDLAMIIEDSGKLMDETGHPYVALRPGLTLSEDYQIFPQEAWDLVISWYGLAKESPVLIRYAHDSQADGAELSNVQFELYPPIFSFLKLPAEHTPQTQREANLPPPRLVASRKKPFMQWLKEGKQLVGIDMNTKVRVWRILGGLKKTGSSSFTPVASRSASPAPGAEIVASAGDKMLLDVHTFISLQPGEHREDLKVNDETANSKYNGRTTLGTVGLGRDEVICLEEQKSGKEEWPSESSKLSIKGLKTAAKSLAPSGRSSPAPGGMVTRGRSKQAGRPRGITGLSNLGNTCYMNSALQCIRSVKELTDYFLFDAWKTDLNPGNPLGHRGDVAKAYSHLIHQIYDESSTSTNPGRFKATIGRCGPSFAGYQQQDSQEFLLFLLDGLQEDLNRVLVKPYMPNPDSTDEMVHDHAALKAFADRNWEIFKARNDSVITDLFAGMYKSTLTCPVCSKVSIIFDPFNNLTLQLPIENTWAKEVLYFPLRKRPYRIDVDIDKHSSISALKDYISKRTNADPQRMLVAESYKNKIYKIFDNNTVISEANIQPADIICVYELSSIPTNYNPNKAKRFSLYTIRDAEDDLAEEDSPEADRLLVPMYNRLAKGSTSRVGSKHFFGQPTYLVLDREDRATYEGVLKKILGNVAGMTTRDILSESDGANVGEGASTSEDSDTVVMADDDSNSDSNPTVAASVQGEEGLVDVSMRDASQAPETSSQADGSSTESILQPDTSVPRIFRNLFTINVASTGEGIPTGWSQITESQDYENIVSRIPKRVAHRPAKSNGSLSLTNGDSESTSSDDELAGDIEHDESLVTSDEDDVDASTVLVEEQSVEDHTPLHTAVKSRNPKSKKGKRQQKRAAQNDKKRLQRRTPPPPPPQPQPKTQGTALIRPGECIVLDWNPDAYDALFSGAESDGEQFHGAPTWKSVSLYHDEELVAKRALRSSRKKNGVTLDDCLAEFGKAEVLSEQNSWFCPRCKEHRRAEKTYELWKVPDILVMHLKRFSSNRNFRDKLEVRVDYPIEGLDLGNMVRDHEPGKSLVYDLVAVDNHYGGLGGGHYTAYAKNIVNGTWYEYNGE